MIKGLYMVALKLMGRKKGHLNGQTQDRLWVGHYLVVQKASRRWGSDMKSTERRALKMLTPSLCSTMGEEGTGISVIQIL